MRIILWDGHARRDSDPLIAQVTRDLGRYGIEVERIRNGKEPRRPLASYEALIANTEFPLRLREHLACYGKTDSGMPSRAETLDWLAAAGLPVMRWSRAQDQASLASLFERWDSDAILMKRSGTHGGGSVSLFTREHAGDLQWNAERDIFCPEVNRDDGDIYKIEMFGPDLLIGWMSQVPNARSRMVGGKLTGIFGAYGRRELFEWPEALLAPARRFGSFARNKGYAHISLDLMRNPQGQYEVIEVNLGNVAIWWTCGFPQFRRRYVQAVHRLLVDRHDAPTQPASLAVRFGVGLRSAIGLPQRMLREWQGAAWRRKTSRQFEAKYADPERG
jgi:hypothetical protein